MKTMRVLRLVVHARTREPVLLLGEEDGDRCLPVFLRRAQADVISVGTRTEEDPLLPQDVLIPVLAGLGRKLERAEITSLVDSVYTAELVFDGDTRVPVLPSDALAIAVREGLPIGVADDILDDVGQPISQFFPDGTDAPPEKQLQDFKEFLADVSPEDFGAPGSG
ncbi:bifunctional nuclease family protein [Pseudonocardia sp.]|jgi:bifunctional DNase/RNase|uniref:bifunctional nuclease family protein n=1 Tax=Pseudonocardia sp. TaxID=60912 RepID=UPI00262B6182|nr:bifunctional nuclease family protein [Pseudonocardia sp.]